MTDVTPDAYTSHARSLVMLLAQTLSSLQSLGNPAAFYVLNTLRHLIPVAKHDETVSIVRSVSAKFWLLYHIYVYINSLYVYYLYTFVHIYIFYIFIVVYIRSQNGQSLPHALPFKTFLTLESISFTLRQISQKTSYKSYIWGEGRDRTRNLPITSRPFLHVATRHPNLYCCKIALLTKTLFQTVHTYATMMPLIMTTIQTFTETDHFTFAIQSFELLDELCENMIVVITPHVKPLVHMCLTIIANKNIDELLKVKVISFIGWLARLKKKALVKHKLVEPIVGERS